MTKLQEEIMKGFEEFICEEEGVEDYIPNAHQCKQWLEQVLEKSYKAGREEERKKYNNIVLKQDCDIQQLKRELKQ